MSIVLRHVALCVHVPGEATGHVLANLAEAGPIELTLGGTEMGDAEVLWVDTPPDGSVRTRYLRCAGCRRWLAGVAFLWSDGALYCTPDCGYPHLPGAEPSDHPDDQPAEPPGEPR